MLLSLLVACGTSEPEAPPAEPAPAAVQTVAYDPDNPESCRPCHTAVVQEWVESMHANAHHDNDPIHAGMRELRMANEGPEIAAKCALCHEPRSPDDVDAPAGKVGVSCSACHLADEVHLDRGPGAKALVYGTTMRGALGLGEGASPVHPTGPVAPHIADGQTLCLACHDATKNPAGIAACTTGPEHRASEDGESCVSCHMPRIEGPSGPISVRESHRSHHFHGPHDAWYGADASFLAESLDLSAAFVGNRVEVTLKNLADHGFPTGFPGRMAWVAAKGRSASGEVVWTSGEPTPDTLMNKVYVNAEGQPVPPPMATELKVDRRLTANEARTFTFSVPAEVVEVEASVAMRLLPPGLAEKLELTEALEGQARTVRVVTATR